MPASVVVLLAHFAVVLQLVARFAHTSVLLAVVPLAAMLFVRSLKIGDLLVGERTVELLLQLAERLRPRRTARPARDDESQRTIEHRELFFGERSR
jgi:hypothetical protein